MSTNAKGEQSLADVVVYPGPITPTELGTLKQSRQLSNSVACRSVLPRNITNNIDLFLFDRQPTRSQWV